MKCGHCSMDARLPDEVSEVFPGANSQVLVIALVLLIVICVLSAGT